MLDAKPWRPCYTNGLFEVGVEERCINLQFGSSSHFALHFEKELSCNFSFCPSSSLQVFMPALVLYLISPILPITYLLIVLILYISLVFYLQLNYFSYFVSLLPICFLLKKKFYWWFFAPLFLHLLGLVGYLKLSSSLNYFNLFKQLSIHSLFFEYLALFPLIWAGLLVNRIFLWFKKVD